MCSKNRVAESYLIFLKLSYVVAVLIYNMRLLGMIGRDVEDR